MSATVIPVRPTEHRHHGWKQPTGYPFAARDSVVPVSLEELPALLAYYPLAIVSSSSASHHLVALLSPTAQDNAYLDPEGRWRAAYIPAHYRAYPFTVVRAPKSESANRQTSALVLCFDTASGLLREHPDEQAGERRFFDDQGQPQPLTAKLVEFLKHRYESRHRTDRAVAALRRAGVLVPWPLPPSRDTKVSYEPLSGLMRVDEQALNALDAEALLTLRDANALSVAYAQILSMRRILLLDELYTQVHKKQVKKGDLPDNVRPLFPEQDDVEFDWDSSV